MSFRRVFEEAPVAMLVRDGRGRFVAANAACVAMFGYPVDELRTLSLADLTHPADLRETEELIRELHRGARDTFRIEKRYVRRDGTVCWGRATGSAIRDGRGAVLYMAAIIEDVTERREAEAQLRWSEERFRTLAEAVPDCFWMRSRHPDALYLSAGFARILHIPYDRVAHDPFGVLEMIHPDDRAMVRAHASRAWTGSAVILFRVVRSDGGIRWLRNRTLSIVNDRGEPRRYAGIVEDVTEQKESIELLTEVCGHAARLVHEMRRPISILGAKLAGKLVGPSGRVRERTDRRAPMRSLEVRLASLTARQREVLDLLVAGESTAEIAEALGISPKTVSAHRAGVMERMEVRKVADLVREVLAPPSA